MLINDLELLCTHHASQHHSALGAVVPISFRKTLWPGEVLRAAQNRIAQMSYESGNVSFQGILASVCPNSTLH